MNNETKWVASGSSILSKDKLDTVQNYLENIGFVVVLWWHYYGSRAPTRLTFDDYEEFFKFIKTEPKAGDAIDVWPFPTNPDTRIAEGKIPNEKGEVPEGGAY